MNDNVKISPNVNVKIPPRPWVVPRPVRLQQERICSYMCVYTYIYIYIYTLVQWVGMAKDWWAFQTQYAQSAY